MNIMVLGGDNVSRTEAQKTRKNSAFQERRNSVSEITEFFQSQVQVSQASPIKPMPTSPRHTRKTSGRLKDKEKNKEREKELKQARENIKAFIAKMPDHNSTRTGIDTLEVDHDNASIDMAIGDASSKNIEMVGDAGDNAFKGTEEQEIAPSNKPTKESAHVSTQTNEDEMLKAIHELAHKYQTVDTTLNDPKNSVLHQLAKTQSLVSELYTDINGAVSGLKVQMQSLSTTASTNATKIEEMQNTQKRMRALLDENQRLVQELKLMQGLIDKVAQQAEHSSSQILDLTKRGMEQNLILHGVDDLIETDKELGKDLSPKQCCQQSVLKFFKEELDLDIEVSHIWKAHRTGQHKMGKTRPLIIKVSYDAKELIMEHLFKLKGRSNPVTKQKYFIAEQVPEGITEKKKQMVEQVRAMKVANDKKPKEKRSKIQVVNDNILVDNEPFVPEIVPPKPSQLFLRKEEQDKIELLQSKIIQSEPVYERGSEFIGLAVKVHSLEHLKQAYIAVSQRFPTADHIILGYAFKEEGKLKTGYCDNREYGAGAKLQKLIFELKSRNTACFVMRKYGGVYLGFGRFGCIESVAKMAIQTLIQAN